MKIKCICQNCGKVLVTTSKESVSEMDLKEHEMSVGCDDHGSNSYVLDEETGEILSSIIVVKAIKVSE